MTDSEIKIAAFICCPWCDEEKCVGRYDCDEIKNILIVARNMRTKKGATT